MELKYILDRNDYFEFRKNMYFHNNLYIMSKKIYYLSLIIFLIIAGIIFYYVGKINIIKCIFYIIFLFLFNFYISKRKIKKILKKDFIKIGENKSYLYGEKSLEITKDYIFYSDDLHEEKIYSHIIYKIHKTKNLYMIYTNLSNVFIVPKRAFNDIEEENQFFEILDQYAKEKI